MRLFTNSAAAERRRSQSRGKKEEGEGEKVNFGIYVPRPKCPPSPLSSPPRTTADADLANALPAPPLAAAEEERVAAERATAGRHPGHSTISQTFVAKNCALLDAACGEEATTLLKASLFGKCQPASSSLPPF